MKKLFFLVILTFTFAIVTHAQEKENEVKVKQTSSAPQKVHNTFSKHKKHNGYKVKKM